MIADPVEETFPFEGETIFLDTDSRAQLRAGRAQSWRDAYAERLARHRDEIAKAAAERRLLLPYPPHRPPGGGGGPLAELRARLPIGARLMGLDSFAAPLALFGLLALPAIYLLLRVTPPRPREIVFPPIRLLLRSAAPRGDAGAHALVAAWRCVSRLAGLAVLAMAGPAVTPAATASFSGAPLLIAIDDGWPAAPDFDARLEAARAHRRRCGALRRDRSPSCPCRTPRPRPRSRTAARSTSACARSRRSPIFADRAAATARLGELRRRASPRARRSGSPTGWSRAGRAVSPKALQTAAARGAEVRILAGDHAPRALSSPQNTAGGLEVDIARASARDAGRRIASPP